MTRKLRESERGTLTDVMNIPVSPELKMLFIAYSRAMGYSEHTPLARAMLAKSLYRAIAEMSEEDKRLMDKIASSEVLANSLEAAMLKDISAVENIT